MKWRTGVCVALIAFALVLVPGVALADTFQYSGTMASAYGEVWGENAEMPEMFIGVSVGDQISKSHVPGTKVDKYAYNGADVFIDWPAATPDGIGRSLYLTASPYDPGIDRSLSTAALHADMEGTMTEYTMVPCPGEPDCWEWVVLSETPMNARVDFDWVGEGALVPYKIRYQDWGFGYRMMDSYSGKYRTASVTGSIEADGVQMADGVAFSGDISQSRGTTIFHGEYPYLP